jgi:cytochrome P450
MICVGAANRDERAFPNADTFDITRDRGTAQNLGLGYGEHSCLGAALARMECIAAIDRMLDFMPRYEIRREGLKRVAMSNVIGWHNVPVRVLSECAQCRDRAAVAASERPAAPPSSSAATTSS